MRDFRRLVLGLVLVSLAGCDGLEKAQPKPLDGVPPEAHRLTVLVVLSLNRHTQPKTPTLTPAPNV